MKCVFGFLFVAYFVALGLCQGIPTKTCPKGEHSVLYCPQRAEPSCDNPELHNTEHPMPCGVPQCFCDQGTIRNTATNCCVAPQNC